MKIETGNQYRPPIGPNPVRIIHDGTWETFLAAVRENTSQHFQSATRSLVYAHDYWDFFKIARTRLDLTGLIYALQVHSEDKCGNTGNEKFKPRIDALLSELETVVAEMEQAEMDARHGPAEAPRPPAESSNTAVSGARA